MQTRSDVLVGRLEKYARDAVLSVLEVLGRLTMCTRQLDMLMDTDASPDFFAAAFLSGHLHHF